MTTETQIRNEALIKTAKNLFIEVHMIKDFLTNPRILQFAKNYAQSETELKIKKLKDELKSMLEETEHEELDYIIDKHFRGDEKCHCIFTPIAPMKKTYECPRCKSLREKQPQDKEGVEISISDKERKGMSSCNISINKLLKKEGINNEKH